MNENKNLFGENKTVKIEVQNHRRFIIVGSFKEAAYTLRLLSSIFGSTPIASIPSEEIERALRAVEEMKAIRADNELRRRICGN